MGQLSVEYQSRVNLSGESNGFSLSKDVINYSYHAMGEPGSARRDRSETVRVKLENAF